MDRVINVSSADSGVLERTESDGILGRSLLTMPLSTHLRDAEAPAYVAWNKKRGVTCIHGGPDTYTPPRSYRAFAVATDVRLLFVVGGNTDGQDRVFSLPYNDVLTVETTTNVMSTTLELVAEGEQRWQFACRGDIEPVATYVDESVQCWTRAESLFDRAEDLVGTAREAVTDGDLNAAETALDDAEQALDDARSHLDELGPGAVARADDLVTEIERNVTDARGRLVASRGDRAHHQARTAWNEGEFTAAYDDYERARDAYERARDLGATDLPLADRLAAVSQECEKLARAPLDGAREAAEAARETDDPAAAAERWETTVDRYQDAVTLDWGRERRFAGDPDELREAAADAATELVDARRAAAQDRLNASDWLVKSGDEAAARTALRDARAHLERANEVARELVPDRRTASNGDLAAVAERIATLEADTEV